MKRTSFSWFLRGFAIAVAAILVSLAVYGARQGLAQTGGNANGSPVAGVSIGDETNTTPTTQEEDSTVIEENTLPEGDSVLKTDNPTGENPIPGDLVIETQNGAGQEEFTTDSYGTEGINATPWYVNVPAADFRSDGYAPDLVFFDFSLGSWRGGPGSTCLMAPVYLPNGVQVAQLYGTFVDTDASNEAWINLYRKYNYDTSSANIMGSISTGVAFAAGYTNPGDETIVYPDVSYPNYSYYLGGCMTSSSLSLIGVRVYYLP
jgi:hypothetical protein